MTPEPQTPTRMQANLRTKNRAHQKAHDWNEECDMTPDCHPAEPHDPDYVAAEVEELLDKAEPEAGGA